MENLNKFTEIVVDFRQQIVETIEIVVEKFN